MKAVVLQENLYKTLSLVNRFVSSKAQLPVLANILLEAKEGQLFISATNLEAGVQTRIPAKIESEGAVAIPARILLELIAGLPKDKIELTQEGEGLRVIGGKHRSLVNGMTAAEFPPIPRSEGKPSLVLDKKTLIDISSQVSFASSLDEGRPALTGVLVLIKQNGLCFVATDGFRLSLKNIGLEKKNEEAETQIILPAKIFLEAGKIVQEKEGDTGVVFLPDGNQVLFVWEDTVLSSRLIDGKFPPYEKIIPAGHLTTVVVDKEEFLKSIKLASIFARENANIIKIKTGKQRLQILAKTPQTGDNENEIEAKTEGEEGEISFNGRYLLDYLNSAGQSQIQMEFSGPLAPGVFRQAGDGSYLHIIMPVRV